jgi:hypothetical protein
MFKHIIGQAILQLIIMIVFLFAGPSFIPEYSDDFDEVLFDKFVKLKGKKGGFPKDFWWQGKYSV